MNYTKDLAKRIWTEYRCIVLFGPYKLNSGLKYTIFSEFYLKRSLYAVVLVTFYKTRWIQVLMLLGLNLYVSR